MAVAGISALRDPFYPEENLLAVHATWGACGSYLAPGTHDCGRISRTPPLTFFRCKNRGER